ncbi:AI-2E family transporter [Rhodococcus sp. IEGM 1381]|uniref:AI-2E family transporter n=1 Tax=Rhodococcus sp. IEGM 1381 TaxID=3047085 RepID=UPI0024B7FFB9|nr:AI-2E family transporter [Rhodococcus sp. IEGM 1381]MDI9894073.1 AI-2E family transporter [Rhodococcus sp. IEGM 1381]
MHPLVRVGAEWTWRLLVLFAGFITFAYVVAKLSTVVIPLGLALLASAMLVPVVDWMHRRGVPRAVAVIIVIIASIGVVAGIMTFIVEQFIEGLPQVGDQFTQSINGVEEWLSNGPLHISEDQIRQATDNLVKVIQDNQEAVTSGALTTAAVIGEILTGALLTLFTLIFFLYGGDQIWQFVTRLAPTGVRRKVRTAGIQGFGSLVGYVRATVAVAAADAIGIGAGLAILGVPLALPLASLVFIGAFIPIIGAVLTGFVAVFIALVTKGLITAVITLGIVIAVMQLEGHVLQPLLLGRAVRLHPLAVVLSITVGILLAGIVGGLLAVPIVAVLNTAVRSLLADDPQEVYEELEPTDPLYAADASDPHTPPGADEPDRLAKGELKIPDPKNDADG